MLRRIAFAFVTAVSLTLAPVHAQPTAPAPYGAPISLANAEAVLDAAQAEAERGGFHVAMAVVDSGGHLVAFRRMDGVGTAIVDIAVGKARTASSMRQPSGNLEGWAASSSAPVAIPGIMPFAGGLPLEIEGRIVGGIGVSGVASADDVRIATAGAAALVD